jgi:hypothetical protein
MATAFNTLSARPASFHIAELIDSLQSCVTEAQLRAWLTTTHEFRAHLPELLLSRVERERSRRERELAAIERPSRIRAEQERARRYLDRYSSSGGHRPPILVEIEAAMLRHGIRAASFGKRVVSDPRLVFDLRGGRTLRDSTAGRVRAFIASLDAKRAAND